jgi:predicted enzyme related to lactoylglutathione lyase
VANRFGTDILIQAPDIKLAASFYVNQLGFEITDENPNMISLEGDHINMYIELGPVLGPVFEVTVEDVEEAKIRLVKNGCVIVKDEPEFPRTYIQDPQGLIYNLTARGHRHVMISPSIFWSELLCPSLLVPASYC